MSLEVGEYKKALEYCNEYLEKFGSYALIETVKKGIEENNQVESLKFLFSHGS